MDLLRTDFESHFLLVALCALIRGLSAFFSYWPVSVRWRIKVQRYLLFSISLGKKILF